MKKQEHVFIHHLMRDVCAKFKINRAIRFRTGTRQAFTTNKHFPSEIPLTMKTAASNSL